MDMDVISHPVVETVKTQYIAKIGEQVSPAYNEASFAFDAEFYSYPGSHPSVEARPGLPC
jgi:hypothetical protein